MASAFDPIRARLVHVVCGGRGADGALGATAQARSIPAGRFRKGLRGAPLTDPAYLSAAFDCATRWTWLAVEDDPTPTNDYAPSMLRVARVRLDLGILYGAGNEHVIKTAAGTIETAEAAVLDPEARALNHAERIRRAVTWHELVQGDGLDPAIVDVTRDGATELDDLGGGRMVCRTTYRLRFELVTATAYDW